MDLRSELVESTTDAPDGASDGVEGCTPVAGDSSVLAEPAIEAPVEGATACSPMDDSLPRGAAGEALAIMERPRVPCSASMSSAISTSEEGPLKRRSDAAASASSTARPSFGVVQGVGVRAPASLAEPAL
eukprot:scaffold56353_cov69-Phaeocystis_antarctica.AAC.1